MKSLTPVVVAGFTCHGRAMADDLDLRLHFANLNAIGEAAAVARRLLAAVEIASGFRPNVDPLLIDTLDQSVSLPCVSEWRWCRFVVFVQVT